MISSVNEPACAEVPTSGDGSYVLEARRPNVAGTGLVNATPATFNVDAGTVAGRGVVSVDHADYPDDKGIAPVAGQDYVFA